MALIGTWSLVGTAADTATTNIFYDTTATASATDITIGGLTKFVQPLVRAGQAAAQALPTRSAPPREFNKYISASDLLEEFIRWLGEQGLRQKEVYGLPLEYFIKWLVLRACEEDDEEPNVELPALPAPKTIHRCVACGQFMPLAITLALHAWCSASYFAKRSAMQRLESM